MFFEEQKMDYSNVTVADDVDTIFSWHSEGDCTVNKCRLRVYWITWEKALVIISEHTDNSGKKITHATRELIRLVSNLYDLLPHKIMWVEHYSEGNSSEQDAYFQVIITNNQVVKYQINKKQLTELSDKVI